MNKLLDFFNKFEVSPFAALFLILTLLSNSYKLFFIYFLITFVHELGHIIMAKLLRLKINKIKLLAIGFNAEIDSLDYTSSLKEFLICIAGPLTYFLSKYLLLYFYNLDYISYNAFIQANIINKYNLFFNMLPIIPLDGGRILKIIIDCFLTSKRALYLTSTFSIIFTIIFVHCTIQSPQLMIYVFLILTNICFILSINKRWKTFLINRLFFENKYKIKVHNKEDIYRTKNNFLIQKKKILNEKTAILNIINNNKL